MAAPRVARVGDRTWLVAVAASFWGISSIWRGPLSRQYPSLTVVFWEHLVLTLVTLWWLVPGLRRLRTASRRTQLSVLVIGAGSSALATVLFTAAFRAGDPITPQVLQKLQPLIAVALAAVLLRERVRIAYAWFAAPALLGAWLMAFASPLSVSVSSAQAALLALGAASLWAAGTVLGRAARAELTFADLTALRFSIGFVTLAITATVTSTPLAVGWDAAGSIVLLALIPGLLALALYYRALGHTPASRATLAELAFPLSAVVVGVAFLGAKPTASQWAGFAILLAAVVGLAWHEQRSSAPAVAVPHDAREALALAGADMAADDGAARPTAYALERSP
jgi:drug/metabolite transporter (DMT)-like permease